MEKNSSILRRSIPLIFILITMFFAAILIMPTACNNGNKKVSEEDKKADSIAAGKADSVKPAEAIMACRFKSYTLTAAQQRKIFDITNYNRIRRIMFRFYGEKGECPAYVAACGIDENRFCITDTVHLTAITGSGTDYNVLPKNINDQINTRGDFKLLYGIKADIGRIVPIAQAKFQDLILTPMQDPTTRNIYFIITTPTAKIRPERINEEGQIYTNPSPPAPPCEESMCDDLTQL